MKIFEISLTNFLLILIVIFLGVLINQVQSIDENINTIANNTYANLCNVERNNINNRWTEKEYKQIRENLDILWKLQNVIKR